MAKKIVTSLSALEFAALMDLINEKENSLRSLLGDDELNSPLKKALLDGLTEDQREEFIRVEVKKVLSRATGIATHQINDSDKLEEDLHMNSLQVRALAAPFTRIARQFNPEAVITPDECEECDTVDDCVTLVVDKSKS